jgi:sugar lactone lactonase YvrE
MKNKFITILLIALGLLIIVLIGKDILMAPSGNKTGNPYEYNIDEYKKIDEEQICYDEKATIPLKIKPTAIAIDQADNIYVAGNTTCTVYDQQLSVVNTFSVDKPVTCMTVFGDSLFIGTKEQALIYTLDGAKTGDFPQLGEKAIITSIAVKKNTVFVADAGNKYIHEFSMTGDLRRHIGKKDALTESEGFIIPSPYFDLDIGPDGFLWAVNPGKHQFRNYDKSGNLRGYWHKTSMRLDGFSGCCNPTHMAILEDGSFVTSEKGICRVKIHNQAGDFVCVVATPQQFDEGTTISDLAIDSKQNIYVLDPKREQLRVFMKKN